MAAKNLIIIAGGDKKASVIRQLTSGVAY